MTARHRQSQVFFPIESITSPYSLPAPCSNPIRETANSPAATRQQFPGQETSIKVKLDSRVPVKGSRRLTHEDHADERSFQTCLEYTQPVHGQHERCGQAKDVDRGARGRTIEISTMPRGHQHQTNRGARWSYRCRSIHRRRDTADQQTDPPPSRRLPLHPQPHHCLNFSALNA